ncbi:MAG: replication-associated recombination protein A [Cyanobacteria bacterium SIG30]|nr:replication-associated recombination protein A [Cyanobacteria bacterium SIG30]
MNLFDDLEERNKQMPLAQILRPKTLDEFLGQDEVIAPNSPIYNLIKAKRLFSFILYGPPGCGKTTLARLIANEHNANIIELSAVTSGVKDVKEAIENAKENLRAGLQSILFIDEIHRYSKTQQDALLPHIENGTIHLIGSTTENPSFQVIPALLSRVQVIMLKGLNDENVKKLIDKGLNYLNNKYNFGINITKEGLDAIVKLSRGDARSTLNTIENLYFAAGQNKEITQEFVENLLQKRVSKYSSQEHYDLASAFQKSLRGSDPNAAIYYMAKMLLAGEDPRFIARRLLICASEDVGNADFRAFLIASDAYRACEILGMPECRIPLAQACQFVACAKKSNSAIMAIDKAMSDIESGLDFPPPMHLRDAHYKDAKKYGFGEGYIYTHSNPDAKQNFLPDELLGKKYFM